jgi:antitoxin (DNA-binding transcriptional repressor) of toxin-antitoxin stability system
MSLCNMYIMMYTIDLSGTEAKIMRQTTFTELRNQARTFFDAVERGEVVRVFRNGKPIADIVPVVSETPSWKRRIAQPLIVKGVSMSAEILKDRVQSRA